MFFNRIDQFVHSGRLDQIVINLAANSLKRSFKCRKSRQYEGDTTGLGAAHGTNNREPVTWIADVQVGDQDVERLARDFLDGLTHAAGAGDVETMHSQNRR